jgi:O-antigen/teichoic acid export membrane protein
LSGNASQERTAGKVAEAVPWNMVARGLTALFSIAFSMAVVRGLGEYDYGRYSIVQTALGFFTIIYTFGMTEALLKFVPAARGNRPGAGGRVIVTALGFQLAAWLALVVVAVAGGGLVDEFYNKVPIGALLVLGAALGVFGLLFESVCVVFTGLYRTKAVAFATLLARVISLGFVFFALERGWGVKGALIALGAGSAAGVISLLGSFLREVNPGAMGHEKERVGAGRLARYSLPLVGRSFLGQIIWRQSEALIVGYYFGPVLAGYFHLGYNFPQRILEFIPLALWPLVLAGLSEVQSKKEENLPKAIALYYRVLFLLVIPVAVFGVIMGDQIIVVLYGADMAQAGVLCRLFFVVFVIAFLGTPLHMATYVVEKTWVNLAVGAVGAAITLGLDLILIPRYGLYGGVLPTALGLVISNYLQYRIAKRYVPGLQVPWGHLGKVLAASCSILLIYPLRSWAGGASALLCACVASGILFVVAVRLLRVLGDEERDVLLGSNWRAMRFVAKVLSRS